MKKKVLQRKVKSEEPELTEVVSLEYEYVGFSLVYQSWLSCDNKWVSFRGKGFHSNGNKSKSSSSSFIFFLTWGRKLIVYERTRKQFLEFNLGLVIWGLEVLCFRYKFIDKGSKHRDNNLFSSVHWNSSRSANWMTCDLLLHSFIKYGLKLKLNTGFFFPPVITFSGRQMAVLWCSAIFIPLLKCCQTRYFLRS